MAITITLGVYGNTLKLCFYENAVRRYKAVSKNLIGNFDASQWDKKKSRLKLSVPYSEENNIALCRLVSKYTDVLAEHKDIGIDELCNYFDVKKSRFQNSFEALIIRDIENEKLKSGCNYKNYEKLHRRLSEYRPDLGKIDMSEINEAFCIGFRNWLINIHKTNYEKTTKCFMALLRRISADQAVHWSIDQIGRYSFTNNAPLNHKIEELPVVLDEEELFTFYQYDPVSDKGKRTAGRVQLYYDYCLFMLETYMRPIDVLLLKQDNIKEPPIGNKKPFIRYIPKKKENLRSNNKTVDVPLSAKALELIDKYKNLSSDGYIFPFATEERINGYKDGIEGFSKRINLQINTWLKTVDKSLGLNKALHLYVFRHTAISVALNVSKLSVSTVSKLSGASIDVIEKHYNNHTITEIPMGILEAFEERKNRITQ